MQNIHEPAEILHRAHGANPWFVPEFSKRAITAIADQFLDQSAYESWIGKYTTPSKQKSVALILAGNLPLVGFHDVLCVLSSGHRAIVKCSDKDAVLLPWLIHLWSEFVPEISSNVTFTERMTGFDAAIATGSNNSGRYFEYYFRDYPHILRQNRNGVAVLDGRETLQELKLLASDIFLYFGMGCRSISKVYVPEGYDFGLWKEAIAEWAHLEDHHKYKNNLEYNHAIFIINSIPHINMGHLLLKEDEAIASRIGCVHYQYYHHDEALKKHLDQHREEIQCVIGHMRMDKGEHIDFGKSQMPALDQYADGVDTMSFLSAL
jgi:hypothetical protein